MRLKLVLLSFFSILFFHLAADAENRTCVTIAKCRQPPAIDGKIDASEWKNAAVISNFLGADGISTANPNTIAYVMADDLNLYVAVECSEPNPQLPRGFVRAPGDRAFEDDSVQVYIAPENLQRAQMSNVKLGGYEGSYNNWYVNIKAYYEFTVNCMGSTAEAWNDVRDWNAPWTVKTGKKPGAWTAEMAIPFASVGLKTFPANMMLGFNIFRNRAAVQTGWIAPCYGGYTPMPIGAIYLTENHSVARQALIDPPKPGKPNELKFELRNNSGKTETIEVAVTGTPLKTLTLKAQDRMTVMQPYALNGEGPLTAEYSVRVQGETIPMLSGKVGVFAPSLQQLMLRYFAVPGQVYGDIHLEPGNQAVRAVLTTDAGSRIKCSEANLAGKPGVTLVLPVTGKPGDKVSAKLQLFSKENSLLAEKTLDSVIPPPPAWLNSKAGLPLAQPLPPYEPISVTGKSIKMIGKNIQYDDFALPSGVTTAGMEILAAPMKLLVKSNGAEVNWQSKKWRILEQDILHVKLESIWCNKNLELKVISNLEYDGFMWNEVSLIPHGKQPIEQMSLDIPLKKDVCKYVYRQYVQKCNAISPVGMRAPIDDNTWIGDENRGIAWITESLEWIKAKDYAYQMEIIPGKTASLWRSSFIDTPTSLTQPYTFGFALHITPTKPISLRKINVQQFDDPDIPDKPSPNAIIMPAKKLINPACGTFECWVKPTFEVKTNSASSIFMDVCTPGGMSWHDQFGTSAGTIKINYNGAIKNFTVAIMDELGEHPISLDAPGTLTPGSWNYLKLSWGDKLSLNVNGNVSEMNAKGAFGGDVTMHSINLWIRNFQIDEVRISNIQRPGHDVPKTGFSPDKDTLLLYKGENLEHPEMMAMPGRKMAEVWACERVPGKFGNAIAPVTNLTRLEMLEKFGKKIIGQHEAWSRFQGYPDLGRLDWLKALSSACHSRGMRFTLYFSQQVSDACPEWKGMEWDFTLGPPPVSGYTRSDISQSCYIGCGNGPFRDLILDGVAKLADQAGIDGVFMDGTTMAWPCENPTHPGCGVNRGDGTYQQHKPVRAVREFMKRIRNIFVQRGKEVYMSAHCGGTLNIATLSFCDTYLEGETLHRYKSGFRLTPDVFASGYMSKQFGLRGLFDPGPRSSYDLALAVSLVHDTMVLNEQAGIYDALADYQDEQTSFIPYWDKSSLYQVTPSQVLSSVYLNKNKAMMVFGSQTEKDVNCIADISGLLKKLPTDVQVCDAMSNEKIEIKDGKICLAIPGREWRMIEIIRK
ncbi:MAG: glycoside hydrolase domain-containing protein [Lentisphaeria bacterium]